MLKLQSNDFRRQGIVITDSLVQPDGEGCFKIFVENHSLESVYLDQKETIGVLESVTPIPSKMIPTVMDLQWRNSEKEENILLCNVQPRVNTLLKDIPVNWSGLASSETAELELLIKE